MSLLLEPFGMTTVWAHGQGTWALVDVAHVEGAGAGCEHGDEG